VDLFPAIDIRAGRVVRLRQGVADRQTAYQLDPVAQAEQFLADGARWIHLVDLDRAFGSGDSLHVIRRIASQLGSRVRLQVGGGLRSIEALAGVLELQVARAVLGTAVVTDPELVSRAAREFGGERVAAGLDARAGRVAIRGWVETSDVEVTEVCRRLLAEGLETVIYTDIDRDGMLAGPDLVGAVRLQDLGARVIASGGVSSLDDLRAIRQAGLAGAIVGRALYDQRFTLIDALKTLTS
jgi:phosphoribosylformimino-5-aminoimidazole carboxamide ribotide isomerase